MLKLAPKSELTIPEIRRVISRSGFTPREARVTVTGTLTRADGQWELIIPETKTRYQLTAAESAADKWEALRKIESGQVVRIVGRVAEKMTQPPKLDILDFTRVKPDGGWKGIE